MNSKKQLPSYSVCSGCIFCDSGFGFTVVLGLIACTRARCGESNFFSTGRIQAEIRVFDCASAVSFECDRSCSRSLLWSSALHSVKPPI